jgi:iduronate 2-sulfatase
MLINNQNNSRCYNHKYKVAFALFMLFGTSLIAILPRTVKFTSTSDCNIDGDTSPDDFNQISIANSNHHLRTLNNSELLTQEKMTESVKSSTAATPTEPQYNILILWADDMSATAMPPYVKANHPMFNPALIPPLTNFLRTATVMRGIAPQTVCGPSRASILTGRNPDQTKIVTFERLIPQADPKIQTIFGYFKQHAYETFIAGKIFHNQPADSPKQLEYNIGQLTQPRVSTQPGNSECVGYWYCTKNSKSLADTDVTNQLVNYIKSKQSTPNQRWIAGGGWHRPHLTESIAKSILPKMHGDIPNYTTPIIPGAVDFQHSLAHRADIESTNYKVINQHGQAQKISQGYNNYIVQKVRANYYRAIGATWFNIGSVLNQLEASGFANNTVIVFLSDHGWQNFERNIIGKNTLFPEATNVPLFIHLPGQTQGYFNDHPVSTKNLFPTLIEYVFGANALKNFDDGSGMPLSGTSMLRALNNANNIQIEDFAVSQYPRCQPLGSIQTEDCMTGPNNESCNNPRPPILFMGYSAISSSYRYVEWRRYHEERTVCQLPTWPGMPAGLHGIGQSYWWQIDPVKTGTDWSSQPLQPELYTVDNGEITSVNLAVNPSPANQALMNQFSSKLKQKMVV